MDLHLQEHPMGRIGFAIDLEQNCNQEERMHVKNGKNAMKNNGHRRGDDTICRLNESAEKWTSYAMGNYTGPIGGFGSCPLCIKFAISEYPINYCKNCPICLKTGLTICGDTPFRLWSISRDPNTRQQHAMEEAKFLQNLLFELTDEMDEE